MDAATVRLSDEIDPRMVGAGGGEGPPNGPPSDGVATGPEPGRRSGGAGRGRAEMEAWRGALLDSRERWRGLVVAAADFAFETDALGRFAFVWPDEVLGWSANTLIGQPTELLLARADSTASFDPFAPGRPQRNRRAWVRRADGGFACLSFCATPLLGPDGVIQGARGIAQDVTALDDQEAGVAAALRRGQLLDHILWRMRQEVLAPRMMQAALQALASALGAEGSAVIDMLGDGVEPDVLHTTGSSIAVVLPTAMMLLEGGAEPGGFEPVDTMTPDGRTVLVCPSQTRFGEQIGLALWRAPGGRPWDPDDRMLAGSATGIIRVILEHDSIQREMARQARTDPLTGLLNRRAFLEDVSRRIDRLDRDGLPGTLVFVDLDHFKALNDRCGHDVGDDALCTTAALLRTTVRPTDLVARLGGDEFALFLDGADSLVAAERAETLRIEGPRAIAPLSEGSGVTVTMSMGIATRWARSDVDIDTLMQLADEAMYEVKRGGRGQWRVARTELNTGENG